MYAAGARSFSAASSAAPMDNTTGSLSPSPPPCSLSYPPPPTISLSLPLVPPLLWVRLLPELQIGGGAPPSSSGWTTRSVSCRAERVRKAEPPIRTGAWAGGPRAPLPFGHGTASALTVPDNTRSMSSACSPSRYNMPSSGTLTLEQQAMRSGKCQRRSAEGAARCATEEEMGEEG